MLAQVFSDFLHSVGRRKHHIFPMAAQVKNKTKDMLEETSILILPWKDINMTSWGKANVDTSYIH